MNNTHIDTILNELYAIDPALKEHEAELRKLIVTLVSSKPDTRFDESFARALRARLIAEAPSKAAVVSPYSQFLNWRLGVGASVFAVLVVLLVATNGGTVSLKPKVTEQTARHFGSLATNVGTPAANDVASEAPTFSKNASGALNQTSPATPTTLSTNATATGPAAAPLGSAGKMATLGTGGAPAAAPNTFVSPITAPTLVYRGAPLALSATGTVYRRVKGGDTPRELSSLVKNLHFGNLNFGSFSNLQVSSIELKEEAKDGYTISANFDEGTISVNPRAQNWSNVAQNESKVPSKEELVAIADAFVKSHGIDTSSFAAPEVENSSYSALKNMNSLSPVYVSQPVGVIYPRMIEGKQVSEQDGAPYGLFVTVSVAERRVTAVMNLTTETYESSPYELETDASVILAEATKSASYQMEGAKRVSLGLDTPREVLMHYYKYSEDGTSAELFVPALSFKVIGQKPEFYPQTIVVPLPKEMLESRGQPVTRPMIK